jgi:hypothetical protein
LKEGKLFLPVSIDQTALAEAFADNDFETAFKPFADRLDLMQQENVRAVLDKLVEAIRRI